MNIKVGPHLIEILNSESVNEHELNVNKCYFTFSDEYTADLVKVAVFLDSFGNCYQKAIINNECDLPYLENNGKCTIGVYAFSVDLENGTKTIQYSPTPRSFKVQAGSYIGSDEEITASQFEQYEQALHDGLDDLSEAMETMETTVNAKLGEMNEALGEVETATTEANNLNLDVSKSGKVATVTLTKKDASIKVVTLSDGTSLMFQWDGTKLGIKTDEEESYTYVDLQGVRGETGLTPNIQIGTVVSGSTPSVTRTGTNENPILNFTLVKGDKGDTGNTGETGEDGNGIVGIEKTATSGLVDTYTITYTNGTTTTFNVTNGEDGEVTQTQLDETNKRVDLNSKLRNALPKVTGTGTEITLNDTAEVEMVLSLSGNTTQEEEPTPSSPQDIVNVTGDNSVKISSKNKFNGLTGRTVKIPSGGQNGIRDFTGNGIYKGISRNNYYIPNNVTSYNIINNSSLTVSVGTAYYGVGFDFITKPNTDYILGYSSSSTSNSIVGVGFFDANGNYISNVSSTKGGFTTPTNCKYALLVFTSQTVETVEFNNIQLEEGNISTPYVDYAFQTYPITLGNIEMASNTSVKDTFEYDKDSNKWYLVKYIGKVVLDGSETWTFAESTEKGATIVTKISTLDIKSSVISDYFGSSGLNAIFTLPNKENNLYLRIDKNIVGIVSGNKYNQMKNKVLNWLSNNNTLVQYKLTEPTRTEITDITLINQLEAIRLAYAYQDQTNITQTNDGAPFNIDAEAVADVSKIISNLTNAIIEIGGGE